MGEIDTILLIQNILTKIGFKTISQRNFYATGLDLLATKIINKREFKIGVELKTSIRKDAVNYGFKTLARVNEKESFDKLVLVTSNKIINKPTELELFTKLQHENPFDFEILNILELNKWSQTLINKLEPEKENKVLIIFREAYRKIISEISKNPQQLQNLDWFNIEKVIAELFENFGFNVTLTPPSKDGGKDIILECYEDESKKTFIVEIKHWKAGNRVGKSIVTDFLKVVLNEKRDRGLILSSSGYTKNSLEFVAEIDKSKVALGNHSKIISLCNAYERVKDGLLLPISNYESFLFNETI